METKKSKEFSIGDKVSLVLAEFGNEEGDSLNFRHKARGNTLELTGPCYPKVADYIVHLNGELVFQGKQKKDERAAEPWLERGGDEWEVATHSPGRWEERLDAFFQISCVMYRKALISQEIAKARADIESQRRRLNDMENQLAGMEKAQ